MHGGQGDHTSHFTVGQPQCTNQLTTNVADVTPVWGCVDGTANEGTENSRDKLKNLKSKLASFGDFNDQANQDWISR